MECLYIMPDIVVQVPALWAALAFQLRPDLLSCFYHELFSSYHVMVTVFLSGVVEGGGRLLHKYCSESSNQMEMAQEPAVLPVVSITSKGYLIAYTLHCSCAGSVDLVRICCATCSCCNYILPLSFRLCSVCKTKDYGVNDV